jgi:hypothetical protein
MHQMTKTVLILGAGFSVAGGLPPTSKLMDGNVWLTSQERGRQVETVLDAWNEWSADQGADVPEFLRACFKGEVKDPTDGLLPGGTLPWRWVAQYIAMRLSEHTTGARGGGTPRYYERIVQPSRVGAHLQLLKDVVADSELSGVVTTNYDLLAERALRHRPVHRWPVPGFYYAGLARPQLARGTPGPWRNNPDLAAEVELTGDVPLCKLHGSLNWRRRVPLNVAHGATSDVSVWQDLRSSYRLDADPAIIAPIPELFPSRWLEPIWTQAKQILKNADHWIVVGYSMPQYDHAIRRLLAEASRGQPITIRDPASGEVAEGFSALLPQVIVTPSLGI